MQILKFWRHTSLMIVNLINKAFKKFLHHRKNAYQNVFILILRPICLEPIRLGLIRAIN